MNRNIACVGSRETPDVVLAWMESTGAALVRAGYRIISGNAPGADQAWARGGNSVDPRRVTLCLPWEDFETGAIVVGNVVKVLKIVGGPDYVAAVRATHPNFANLSSASIRLHARNAMIVEDVHLVLGYLNPGKPGGGGTGGAFRIAQRNQICTLNVADAFVRAAIDKRLSDQMDLRGPVFDTKGGKKF